MTNRKPLPEIIDPFESLDGYTTDQLRTLNASLERELLATMADAVKVDAMSEPEKVAFIDAIGFLTRTGAEIRRRELLPVLPSAVCYESGPHGDDPTRLSFSVLCF